MQVELRLDERALRRWHVELAAALDRRKDVQVTVRFTGSSDGRRHAYVERVLGLERLLHGLRGGRSERVDRRAFGGGPTGPAGPTRSSQGEPDLVLDLVGAAAEPGIRTWHLTFDGVAGEAAVIAALLEHRMPTVALVDAHTGALLACGRPGSETPGVVVAALEDVLARCTGMVTAVLDGAVTGSAAEPGPGEPSRPLGPRPVLVHGAASVARAGVHRAYRALYRAPHWRVGWRFVEGPDVVDLCDHPAAGWQELPDDGLHFYADPFPVVVDGRTYLFVEDFEHRVGRGVISVVPFDEAGPVGRPRPVLEHEVHLSYPFVLEDEGRVWMVPETSAAGTVELYRAARFPDEWVREAVLLQNVEASDATPFRHAGRWWLSATVRDGGSFSDALHLWSADRLRGPWTPHPRNPVLVDIAAARPAGRVVSRHGRLIRPVQDGRHGYGAGLALAEVTRLDEQAFTQQVVARIGPGPRWPGTRLHTLNRAGRLECIDGSARSPRFRR